MLIYYTWAENFYCGSWWVVHTFLQPLFMPLSDNWYRGQTSQIPFEEEASVKNLALNTLLPQRWHNFWAGDKNQQGVNKPIFCTYARLLYHTSRVETSLISISKGFPLVFVSSCILSHICNHFQITTNLNTQLVYTTINFMANDTRKKDWLTCGQIVVLILKSTTQLPL